MMTRERAAWMVVSPLVWRAANAKPDRTPWTLGVIVGVGVALSSCRLSQPAPAPRGDVPGTVYPDSTGSAPGVEVRSSSGVAREAETPSATVQLSATVQRSATVQPLATVQPSTAAQPSATGVSGARAPAPLPAADSACLLEFERKLPELPACKAYFQSWMAAFSDASTGKAWQRWAEFVLPEAGLLIDNTYEATLSDPASTGSSSSDTIPHSAFLDGTALQRFEQLDLRGGLRCIEDDDVWCPDFLCRPHGTQIACSNQGGGDPFQYRWTLRQNNWYLTEIYQTWPN